MGFDYTPIILSLKVATAAVIIVVLLGIPLAGHMARRNFPGKDLVEAFVTLPLVLPPSVVGFILLWLFGKNGPLGQFLAGVFHVSVVFNLAGAVIAAAVVSFPMMYQSTKAAMEGVDKTLENAARTLGAGELRVFLTITIPLSWPGIVSGFILSFARSLGEFGATLMIAGNIPGKTQTMPIAIYMANEGGDTATAMILVVIMTVFSFLVIFWLNRWSKRQQKGFIQEEGGE
ncbi:MAG: molybdate ABC transporter permease subunit [Dehalobacter sp. 4CP]|uniref:molybdate ABC transporter permease subunit n=1 Tax=Dehalobacter sp. CP TaxID=2594474 RepID=UPI0013C7E1F1|nr:molybdate ABC transporter permease subunit [Dehalobacter sp. 4CP]